MDEKTCTCDPGVLLIYGCSCRPLPAIAHVPPPARPTRWYDLPIAARLWRDDGKDLKA